VNALFETLPVGNITQTKERITMKNSKPLRCAAHRRWMGGVVGLGFLALLGAGVLTQSVLTSHERTQHAAPGKMVSVGTHRLHLNCQGSGQPLVLLESGLSGWSQDWALVQPQLARQTTVCSYDRAGYAWSDESPAPRTGLLAVEDLRTLLRAAGLQGPVVVVGHSWGGMLAQMLAQTHPDEVAGLVLVDALHHDQTASMDPDTHARYSQKMRLLMGSATWLAPLGLTRLAGMPASVVLDKLPASEQAAARGLAMQSKNYQALYTEYRGIDPALGVARSLPSVPAVPTVVLSTNALSEFPPGWESDYMRQHWINGQRLLARDTGARHVVVADAGHYLQLERPELVIAAVQEVLQQVRRSM
jgi:pimeloyl-ACP methyl ester carboxylesterase